MLKYLLFAYRQAPHANSGYSPFELIFSRQLRGPLDVARESWLSCDASFQDVFEWVAKLRKELRMMHDITSQKEVQAKCAMKKQYDSQARPRQLVEGTLALVRTPELGGKLSEMWDGPYEE